MESFDVPAMKSDDDESRRVDVGVKHPSHQPYKDFHRSLIDLSQTRQKRSGR